MIALTFWTSVGFTKSQHVHSSQVHQIRKKNQNFKFRQPLLGRVKKKLSRRYAQKGYTCYAKHKGSLCPRDNGEKQKNWLPRDLVCCDAHHHVRKKIACLSRWRVRMDKWTNNMNVWSAQNSFHIHSWLRLTIIISSSNIVHCFIIHHTCWTPLPATTTTATSCYY